jgi:hypothetical protein
LIMVVEDCYIHASLISARSLSCHTSEWSGDACEYPLDDVPRAVPLTVCVVGAVDCSIAEYARFESVTPIGLRGFMYESSICRSNFLK